MNRTTSKVRMCEQDYIEYVRTGPQVEYVTKRSLVRYVCMNRTTSKVRMCEQDH